MSILAEIASGDTDTADLFFLFAVILAVVAAVLAVPRRTAPPTVAWSAVLGWLALACAAFGWLVL